VPPPLELSLALIGLGVLAILQGALIGGFWWCLIGLFMRGASQMAYRQLLIRRSLEGENLRRFMRTDPITVPPDTCIRDFVDDYIYKYHYKFYPVSDDENLSGWVKAADVKEFERDEWPHHTVKEITGQCDENTCISPHEDPMKALSIMNRTGNSRMLVVENGKLVGLVALKDLLEFLSLKIDLEEGAGV